MRPLPNKPGRSFAGDWLTWFAYLRARLGDLDGAAQLLDRTVPSLDVFSEIIRTHYGLSPNAQPGDLASILERAAQQTDLLSNEIAHWEQIANARL